MAENLFKSRPWRNPTKVKISCLYSPPHPVSLHTSISFLHCIKSQSSCKGLTKMVPDIFSHVIYMRVISRHVMFGPFSCLLSPPEPVCHLLGFISQAPANHSSHTPLPMSFWLVLPRKHLAKVSGRWAAGKRKKPGYFLPLPHEGQCLQHSLSLFPDL